MNAEYQQHGEGASGCTASLQDVAGGDKSHDFERCGLQEPPALLQMPVAETLLHFLSLLVQFASVLQTFLPKEEAQRGRLPPHCRSQRNAQCKCPGQWILSLLRRHDRQQSRCICRNPPLSSPVIFVLFDPLLSCCFSSFDVYMYET